MALAARLILRNNLARYSAVSSPRIAGILPAQIKCSHIRPIAICAQRFAQQQEDFFAKNKRLERPLSPHLTIYKLQVTSMLSITHRGTGLGLATVLCGFSIGMLCSSSSFPQIMEALQASHYAPATIATLKFIVAWPFFFHFANGIRHLAWDMGYGYELKQLYATGYAVLGLSTVLALIASFM